MSSIKDERERRRRIRESVQSFYSVEAVSPAPSPSMAGGMMRGASPAYPSAAAMAGAVANSSSSSSSATDIDSTAFNPTAYTTALLKQSSLPSLLETDTVLRRSVKALDKDLQELVYSNYSKFIHAAETIKEVRSSVNDMETRLTQLDKNVEQMEAVSGRVTRELERHRHLVDQEVATNTMLRKVQFLVMLPQVMASAAQAEKYPEAANFFAAGDAIFTRYAEFPSFVRTQQECRLKAEELYATVSHRICNCGIETLTFGTDPKSSVSGASNIKNSSSGTSGSSNNDGDGGGSSSNAGSGAGGGGGNSKIGDGASSSSAGGGGGAGGSNNSSSSSSKEDPAVSALRAGLKSKLAALRILAKTSIDPERLHSMGVQLLPPLSELQSKPTTTTTAAGSNTEADDSSPSLNASVVGLNASVVMTVSPLSVSSASPSRFTGEQVTARARQFLTRKLISAFREQIDDAVAHTKLDFMRRKEDLDRHAKKVRQQLSNSSASSDTIKASLVDLSLALRTRTIAKLEDVIVRSFIHFTSRLAIVEDVCNAASAASSSSSDPSNNNTITDKAATAGGGNSSTTGGGGSSGGGGGSIASVNNNVKEVLEPALSRFLDEVCAATSKWMQSGVDTFAGCLLNAANYFAEQGRPPPGIVVADVETTIAGMCRTFFDALYDTEKTFCTISSRFLHFTPPPVAAANAAGGSDGNNTTVSAAAAASTGGDGAGGNIKPLSVAQIFNRDKVAPKTKKLLAEFEALFATSASFSNNRRKLMEQAAAVTAAATVATGGGTILQQKAAEELRLKQLEENGGAATTTESEETKLLKQCNIRMIPILCNAAIARACALHLPKSDLAAHGVAFRDLTQHEKQQQQAITSSAIATTGAVAASSRGLDWDDDEAVASSASTSININHLTANSSSGGGGGGSHTASSSLLALPSSSPSPGKLLLRAHLQMFQGAAAALSNLYVRSCGLFCLTEHIRPVLCDSTRFCHPHETLDPIEPSTELAVPLVRFLRVQCYMVQLLLADSSSAAGHRRNDSSPVPMLLHAMGGNSGSNVAPQGQHQQQQQQQQVLVAQFTRRDVTATLKADMERMFAARSAAAVSGSGGGGGGAGSLAAAGGGGGAAALLAQQQQHQQQQQLLLMGGNSSNNPAMLASTSAEISANSGSNSNQLALHQLLLVPRGPGSWFCATVGAAGLSALPECGSVVEALLMHVMTSLVETVQSLSAAVAFTRAGFQQMQVDVSLMLHLFADLRLLALLASDEVSTTMATELLCSAFERTGSDRSPLPNSTVEHLASARWKMLRGGK